MTLSAWDLKADDKLSNSSEEGTSLYLAISLNRDNTHYMTRAMGISCITDGEMRCMLRLFKA